jgi:hypothetical protein
MSVGEISDLAQNMCAIVVGRLASRCDTSSTRAT